MKSIMEMHKDNTTTFSEPKRLICCSFCVPTFNSLLAFYFHAYKLKQESLVFVLGKGIPGIFYAFYATFSVFHRKSISYRRATSNFLLSIFSTAAISYSRYCNKNQVHFFGKYVVLVKG